MGQNRQGAGRGGLLHWRNVSDFLHEKGSYGLVGIDVVEENSE